MSVIAPKIRKKSDSKPQSQINKCNNEKRRRELENDTINQLEELLVACLSDVKQPDKNGIVQQAADQIRNLLDKRRLDVSTSCASECTDSCLSSAPLQHGDVSSTHPLHRTEITNLIEALTNYTDIIGWALLGINSDGEIESVSDNISDFINWDREDLHRQSIYDYLHNGDHHKFESILRNMPTIWSGPENSPGHHIRGISARFLVKPSENSESTDEDEYKELLLSATLMREGEHGSFALCVVRHEEDLTPTTPQLEGASSRRNLQQITFKLDLKGIILRGGHNTGARYNNLEGKCIHDLVHPSDSTKLADHFQAVTDAASSGAITGPPTRIRFPPSDPYLSTRPQSRIFLADPTTNDKDFIISTFTMLTDNEVNLLESNSNNSVPPVGGPLMTSAIVNGNGGSRNGQFPPSPASEPSFTFNSNEFEFDYFTPALGDFSRNSPAAISSFPFSPMMEDSRQQEERTTSSVAGSGPPTPRTPHTSAPATPVTPLPPPPAPTPPIEPDSARLRNLLSKKESPAPHTPASVSDQPATPATPTPVSSSVLVSATTVVAPSGNNQILKGLLHQEDEEDALRSAPPSVDAPSTPNPSSHQRPLANNMLLKLLNEKSDEEDPDQRNMRSRSELLSQLLKEGGNNSVNVSTPVSGTTVTTPLSLQSSDTTGNSGEDLLHLLGFGGQKSALKRKLMQEEQIVKRPHGEIQVSSTGSNGATNALGHMQGPSKLWEKNRMLASLLAKQPSAPTTPTVPLPNPHLSRTFQRPPTSTNPQRHPQGYHPNNPLTHLLNNKSNPPFESNSNNNNNSNNGSSTGGNSNLSPLQMMLQGAHRPAPAAQTPSDFRPGSGGVAYVGDATSDPLLSVILDEVMDIVPETYNPENSELINLINSMDSQAGQQSPSNQQQNTYQVMNEKMAINAIQKSLMQCETAVKSPSSPGVPPAYPNSTQASGRQWVGRFNAQGQQAGAPQQQQNHQQKAQLSQQQAQQKARLLQAQQQQMIVGGAGGSNGPPTPLHATMDALINASTPPNVSLQRAADAPPYPPPHYHHMHHGSGSGGFPSTTGSTNAQDSPSYKLSPQQQQNPMLNAQLTVSSSYKQSAYGVQRGSPLAPHTPMTPHAPLSPYVQPPPRLQRHLSLPTPPIQVGSGVGGFYGGGVAEPGYCVEQPPMYPRAHNPNQTHQPHHHSNHMSGMTSEYVRQELRAVVGARTGAGGVGGGGGGGARPPDHLPPPPPDLESLGLTFEMPSTGGVVGGGGGAQTAPNAQKLWETHQNSTSTMEEVRGGDHKASLLQKLLSE